MAKAGANEVDAAMRLANILEGVAKGQYPSAFDKDGEWINNEDEPNWFDENDFEHLRAFYDRTMACLTGGLYRVVGGMMVLLDPTNEIVDPDKSYLDLHPKFEKLEEENKALLTLLERASESIGSFVSDEGWAQKDMDTMDSIDAVIARAKGGA